MKYKYIAWRAFRDVRIIDIISETDQYVTDNNGRKHKKISDNRSIFDTFEEAKEWLINTNQIKMNNIFDQVKRMSDRIEEIKNIKVPKRRW